MDAKLMESHRSGYRKQQMAAVWLLAALALGGSMKLALAKSLASDQQQVNGQLPNEVASQLHPRVSPSNQKQELVPSFSGLSIGGEQAKFPIAQLGLESGQTRQATEVTNESLNGTKGRDVRDDYEEAASSTLVQLIKSADHQAPPLMLVAQTRARGAAVMPPEGISEPDEFGLDEPDEADEEPVARGALKPAQMPAASNDRPSLSNKLEDEEQTDERPIDKPRGRPMDPQEAAEASEAEIADKSALDEQQQAQREIILAQAQSEAKAIREQQEALMGQQRLQQQMILRRQGDLERAAREPLSGGKKQQGAGLRAGARDSDKRKQRSKSIELDDDEQPENWMGGQSKKEAARFRSSVVNDETSVEGSSRRTALSEPEDDLIPAAQHNYGAHFGPIHSHQKDNYQFAESFKKGQFHSGFKRGGHKLQVSGHASQHNSHAEGHIKWTGHKGKGVSYWNYQHDGKPSKIHHDDHYSHHFNHHYH